MQKTYLIAAMISIVTAILIIIFADGFRRIYSGLFFILLAVVLFKTAKQTS